MSYTKNKSIQFLKAICIIMVVMLHSFSYAKTKYGLNSSEYDLINDLLFYTCRPMFFVISGFLCRFQNRNSYYKKRFFILIVPFLFFTSIKLFYSLTISNEYAHSTILLEQLYQAFILGELYWFPYAIFVINLFVPLFWCDEEHPKTKKVFVIFLLSVFVNMVLHFFINDYSSVKLPFQLMNAIYFFPFFICGYLFRLHSQYIYIYINRYKTMLIMFSCLFIFVYVLIYYSVPNFKKSFIVHYILCLTMTYLLYLLSTVVRDRYAIFDTIGKYTWQIHFLDSFTKIILFSIISKIIKIDFIISLIIAFINIVIDILVTKVVERTNISMLFGLKKNELLSNIADKEKSYLCKKP